MRRIAAVAVLLPAVCIWCAGPRAVAADADAPASWQALPAETLVAIRIPDGAALIEQMRQQTKFGAVMFQQQRWAGLFDLLKKGDPDEWGKMVSALEEYGLATDDVPKLFAGEAAVALLAEARPPEDALMLAIGWITPGEDLAQRLLDAVAAAVEDHADDEHPVARFDRELSGHEVMHLVIPQMSDPQEFGGGRRRMGPDGRPVWTEGDDQDAEPRVIDQVHVLLSRLGGRLAVAVTFPQAGSEVARQLRSGEEVDLDEVTGIEQAAGMFARFLAAHDGGEGGAFVDQVMSAPGLAAALPEGDIAIEVLGDLGVFYDLMAEYEETVQTLAVIESIGLDRVGAGAYRFVLDGNLLRAGMFVEVPAPRQGLASLLDQPALPPDPPVWVPADILAYTQISADLSAMYQQVKEVLFATVPDQAPMMFGMMEGWVMATLQTDLATLLGSLGTRHVLLTYAPTVRKMAALDGMEMPADRVAIIWEVKDPDLWQRLLQTVAAMPQLQGALKFVEEQGFSGLRLNEGDVEMAVFLGKGHLVWAIGQDIAEGVLASLSHPPDGDAAFRNSMAMQRVGELQRLEPGLMFQAGDMSAYFEKVVPMMMGMFRTMLAGAGPGSEEALVLQGLEELVPSGQELKGVMGVTGGDAIVDNHGLSGQSFVELPPPDDR